MSRGLRDALATAAGSALGAAVGLAIVRSAWAWVAILAVAFVAWGLYWISDLHIGRIIHAEQHRKWRARGKCCYCGGPYHGHHGIGGRRCPKDA